VPAKSSKKSSGVPGSSSATTSVQESVVGLKTPGSSASANSVEAGDVVDGGAAGVKRSKPGDDNKNKEPVLVTRTELLTTKKSKKDAAVELKNAKKAEAEENKSKRSASKQADKQENKPAEQPLDGNQPKIPKLERKKQIKVPQESEVGCVDEKPEKDKDGKAICKDGKGKGGKSKKGSQKRDEERKEVTKILAASSGETVWPPDTIGAAELVGDWAVRGKDWVTETLSYYSVGEGSALCWEDISFANYEDTKVEVNWTMLSFTVRSTKKNATCSLRAP
jgi:hypothetical protein